MSDSVERDASGQPVVRISKADADAYLALDNKGLPSISPTKRVAIEKERLKELGTVEALQIEVDRLNRLVALLKGEISDLKETWQERLRAEVSLRMRGRG